MIIQATTKKLTNSVEEDYKNILHTVRSTKSRVWRGPLHIQLYTIHNLSSKFPSLFSFYLCLFTSRKRDNLRAFCKSFKTRVFVVFGIFLLLNYRFTGSFASGFPIRLSTRRRGKKTIKRVRRVGYKVFQCFFLYLYRLSSLPNEWFTRGHGKN